jgi:PTS system beta-glucosides-specific IIC component
LKPIESAGFSVETPVIITNSAYYLTILEKQGIAAVNSGDELITAIT